MVDGFNNLIYSCVPFHSWALLHQEFRESVDIVPDAIFLFNLYAGLVPGHQNMCPNAQMHVSLPLFRLYIGTL